MKLYIVATPIGNLNDISQRALETLKKVSLILCEDTRNTQKLLNHFEIKTKTLSYHQHSKLGKMNKIVELLKQGDLALVSDAGVPGISDPGNELIKFLLKQIPDLEIVPIPGPSALTSLASVAGILMDKFVFLGFVPLKKRSKFFQEIKDLKYPVIVFESPYRIIKTLKQIKETEKQVIVGRELTKKFEKIYRENIDKITQELEDEKTKRIKGEFTIIIHE